VPGPPPLALVMYRTRSTAAARQATSSLQPAGVRAARPLPAPRCKFGSRSRPDCPSEVASGWHDARSLPCGRDRSAARPTARAHAASGEPSGRGERSLGESRSSTGSHLGRAIRAGARAELASGPPEEGALPAPLRLNAKLDACWPLRSSVFGTHNPAAWPWHCAKKLSSPENQSESPLEDPEDAMVCHASSGQRRRKWVRACISALAHGREHPHAADSAL